MLCWLKRLHREQHREQGKRSPLFWVQAVRRCRPDHSHAAQHSYSLAQSQRCCGLRLAEWF